ncbi:hypothetical protein C8A00DRAFT_13622 [Chaetomidium leptoderma]|uniref:Uncharacterized protein n=1 Tax=Chaetomidium leptoderma TaxID=669021 RepID=A0AAN6VPC7_9PEZI|nr:hypothetical protein C8A00DRAFT_13622 [Chaetomidium leptoderma]
MEMDAEDAMVDCNLAERLVRDLETSSDIFTSRDLTAGCPYASFAAPDLGASCRASYRPQQLSMSHSLVMHEDDSCAEQSDHGRHLGVKTRCLDSSSVTSAGMGLFSIRTRQQSVATAATSVSGRCSSLFSHSTLSPISPVLSPCSSNQEGSPHGTWFEDEPESPQDEPGTSVFTARTSLSDPHQLALDLCDDDLMAASQKLAIDRVGIPGTTPTVYFPGGFHDTRSRPHTPARPLHLEKPRIVDIPPVAIGPKQTLSPKGSRCGADSASIASSPWEPTTVEILPAGRVERRRQASYASSLQEDDPHSSMALLATANGRTVIDASAPPPVIPFASKDQARHHPHARPPPSMTIDENEIFDERKASGASQARKPSLADLRHHWVNNASPETMTSPPSITPSTPGPPSPGVPLPPEVIDSLRVSVACFPETMLLTSSLSVETIRAYSRKVKHRRADLGSTYDADSVYSSSSHTGTRPPKRWNMSWLGSHTRRSNNKHHLGGQTQQQYHHSLPRGTGTTPPPPPPVSETPLKIPSLPFIWTPIQRIFPSAPAHLCDALYAHLLAYNYMTSLDHPAASIFPPPPPSSPTTTRPRTNHHQTTTGSLLQIPPKAASLLGMDMGIDDPVSTLHHQGGGGSGKHQPPRSSGGGNRVLLARASSSSWRTSYLLHEFFNPPAAAVATSTDIGGASTSSGRDGGGGGNSSSQQQEGGAAGVVVRREIRMGLGRCIGLLVAAMRMRVDSTSSSGVADEEVGLLLMGEGGGDGEVEPVLMRALCEVVRCAEEGD